MEDETLLHRFRDCSASLEIWNSLKVRNRNSFYNIANWDNWLISNLKHRQRIEEEVNWVTFFGVTLDLIWRNRNDFVFNKKVFAPLASVLKIRNQVDWIVNCLMIRSINLPQLNNSSVDLVEIWSPPPHGVWKMNCDGSVRNHGRSASCGGILRDEHGSFMFAFVKKLLTCSSLEAELQGILHGVETACSKGYSSLIVESDSLEAINILNGHSAGTHPFNGFRRRILEACVGSVSVQWRHVGRELNLVADQLARSGHYDNGNFVIFDVIPDFLVYFLTLDGCGPMPY